ncbi:tRNA guanosine(34) transglycosylase Tgt [Candidatus Woesearchaeota archaeon]|nr:tRNA guanosine(34) transglycosylase Tgt [Candidatus Woesearchaeota archaeon]
MFEITAKEGAARTGILHTAHGSFETPFFMPVATKGAVKHMSQELLEQSKTRVFISNALVLYFTNFDAVRAAGIHGFMNWKHGIFTDSGGFQILREGFLLSISEIGVRYRSPFDGSRMLLKPEQAIDIQNKLGADVIMALDDVPDYAKYGNDFEKVKLATERTYRWAERCKKAHRQKGQLLFGICQGGIFPELRKESAKAIAELGLDGVALGGLSIGESKETMHAMAQLSISRIPEDKPRYLMGLGSPEDMLEAIELGIDIFDSAFPTQNARHGTLFTSAGKVRIGKQQYKAQLVPLDAACSCFVCRNYTKAYLHHLFRSAEPLAKTLLSFHNIYFIQELLEQARIAIRQGKFSKFKSEFLRGYKAKEP